MRTDTSFPTLARLKTALIVLLTALLVSTVLWNYSVRDRNDRLERENKMVRFINTNLNHQNNRLVKAVDSLQTVNERQVLWMTRALVSETSRTGKEMSVIATTIRNRAELGWRGHHTIKEVVLDPYQFSAFNSGRGTSKIYRNMNAENTPHPELWNEARDVAIEVLAAERSELPVGLNVTHFVHPEELQRPAPKWVYVLPRVEIDGIHQSRFLAFKSNHYE